MPATLKQSTQGFDISAKSAAIIGCGGLGCNTAVHLAGAGIGTLYLCDFDTVSESNLNRQFLYTAADIGRPKTAAIKERLSAYAPETRLIPVEKKIKSAGDIAFAKSCDIIISAVDNIAARGAVQDFCFFTGLPFVNGGIDGDYGVSFMCLPGKTPCMDCAGLISAPDKNGLSVSSSAGIIGAHCAFLAQSFLRGDVSPAGRLFVFDCGEITALTVKSKENCRFCGSHNSER